MTLIRTIQNVLGAILMVGMALFIGCLMFDEPVDMSQTTGISWR